LNFLARAYMYWIALTDCDGFRIDTVKHVSYEQARNFCGGDQGVRDQPRQAGFLPRRLSPHRGDHGRSRRFSGVALWAAVPETRLGFRRAVWACAGRRVVGWSRILTDEEALCVINPNGFAPRGADVLVDAQLNLPGSTMTVILNSARTGGAASPAHPVGSQVPVRRTASGAAYVEIRNVDPSEALVLVNRP
jgi:hypothetical protein